MPREPASPSPLDGTVAVIVSTFPANADAAATIKALLDERLIACGTILPAARSIYVWQDQLQDESEFLVILKTHPDSRDQAAQRLHELHPYDVPEILALPADATQPYAAWVTNLTTSATRNNPATRVPPPG